MRYADRAKAIKTTATVNESPTDKLIRELREEIEALRNGGAVAGSGGQMTEKQKQEIG